jgi:hypothetical protein
MKSEVYSWRLSGALKKDLESRARNEKISLSALLDRVARDWLAQQHAADDEEQARIRARADQCIGAIAGGNPRRSAMVGELMRESLTREWQRAQSKTARRRSAGAERGSRPGARAGKNAG